MSCLLAWARSSDGVGGWDKATVTHGIVDRLPDSEDGCFAVCPNTSVLTDVDTRHTNPVSWSSRDHWAGATAIAVRARAESDGGGERDGSRGSCWADREVGGDCLSANNCDKQCCK